MPELLLVIQVQRQMPDYLPLGKLDVFPFEVVLKLGIHVGVDSPENERLVMGDVFLSIRVVG
jgi:hypothetical protein